MESHFEENLDKSLFTHPKDFVMETAKQKAMYVACRLRSQGDSADVIIGADSVVVVDDQILEKPKTKEKAREMLHRLNNRMHEVYTGVALVSAKVSESHRKPREFYERTEVEFARLTDHVIETYIDTEEPLYGIQGIGGTLVKQIRGDYYNIVGFPLHKFCVELQNWIEQG